MTNQASGRQALLLAAGLFVCLAGPSQAAAGAEDAAAAAPSRLSLEGYIWQNYASREKKPLGDLLEELFAGAAYAGFRNIELNDGFFTMALRDKVIALTRSNRLLMPSVSGS